MTGDSLFSFLRRWRQKRADEREQARLRAIAADLRKHAKDPL